MFPTIDLGEKSRNPLEAWGALAAYSLGIIALAHYVPYVRQLLHTAPFKNDFVAAQAAGLTGDWEFGFVEEPEDQSTQPAQ